MEGMLHLKVVRSPHAHARITAIRKDKALAVPGVHAVFTWEDVPRRPFTTACHDDFHVDPDDTYMLDNVARFVGQRVAAVVAETEAAAEEGCRLVEVDYEVLPAVFDAEQAMQTGAPILHEKGGMPAAREPARARATVCCRGSLANVGAPCSRSRCRTSDRSHASRCSGVSNRNRMTKSSWKPDTGGTTSADSKPANALHAVLISACQARYSFSRSGRTRCEMTTVADTGACL